MLYVILAKFMTDVNCQELIFTPFLFLDHAEVAILEVCV